jgi:hypothetical protein
MIRWKGGDRSTDPLRRARPATFGVTFDGVGLKSTILNRPSLISCFLPLLNFQWVVLRVKGGREPGEANP